MAAAVWAFALSWWSSRSRVPSFGRRAVRLEDLRKAGADVPLGVDCLPLLERGRDHMAGFSEEDRDHLFRDVSRFSQAGSHLGKARLETAAWFPCHTGIQVSFPVTMSKTLSDLPSLSFRSLWRHHSIIPFFC